MFIFGGKKKKKNKLQQPLLAQCLIQIHKHPYMRYSTKETKFGSFKLVMRVVLRLWARV